MKRCSKCKEEKAESLFSKSKEEKDGLQNWCKDCKAEYSQTPVGLESNRRNDRNQREKFPGKKKARNAISNAIRDGKLQRSIFCEECGLSADTIGHHADYRKRLEVDWLCTDCHQKVT